MQEEERLIVADAQGDEDRVDRAIRPVYLQDYVGQSEVKEQLEIFIQAARQRDDASVSAQRQAVAELDFDVGKL